MCAMEIDLGHSASLIDENLVETEIPLADRIPGAVRETEEGDRPIYDEEGYRNDPGGE